MATKLQFILLILIYSLCYGGVIQETYDENLLDFKNGKVTLIRIDENIRYKVKIHESDFSGQTSIWANANIDNTTLNRVNALYFISFHDENDKLIGCTKGSWKLDANSDVNYGSAIIYLDKDSITNVRKYKLRTLVLDLETNEK